MSKSGESTAVHLAPGVREMLVLDDEARIQSMQRERWIDYARASAVLDRLSRLLATPERDRMPCLLLHGESNIGKTQIVRKFIRDHPPSFDERRGVEKRQVISMQMPPLPDQQRFYSALLFEIGAPHNPKAGVSVLEGLTRTLLRAMKPRTLTLIETAPPLLTQTDPVKLRLGGLQAERWDRGGLTGHGCRLLLIGHL
jgi:hypothetical protein